MDIVVMGFDQKFVQLLKLGDIAAAKNLLLKKYPHLKTDSDRIALYIESYQSHYCKGFEATRSGHS